MKCMKLLISKSILEYVRELLKMLFELMRDCQLQSNLRLMD